MKKSMSNFFQFSRVKPSRHSSSLLVSCAGLREVVVVVVDVLDGERLELDWPVELDWGGLVVTSRLPTWIADASRARADC